MGKALRVGWAILAVAGLFSACAKPSETGQPGPVAVGSPYHVGDYTLTIDPEKGTSTLEPLAGSFGPNWGGGAGFTIGVRGGCPPTATSLCGGKKGFYSGGVWSQSLCVYNTSGSTIYGAMLIATKYSGSQPTPTPDNGVANCFANSCTTANNGPYSWWFVTNTTFNVGFIPSGTDQTCSSANNSMWKQLLIATPGSTSITYSLMIYEPSGETVDVESGNGTASPPSPVNDTFVMIGQKQNDPAFPLLGNGNYITTSAISSDNYFAFPATISTSNIPPHSVTAGGTVAGSGAGAVEYANFTIFNTNLGYTAIPLRRIDNFTRYAVGDFNGSLNASAPGTGGASFAGAPAGTYDSSSCNGTLVAGVVSYNMSYADIFNLSLQVLLGPNVQVTVGAHTSSCGNFTTQQQSLPSNLAFPGPAADLEQLIGVRTPLITSPWVTFNVNEYWIAGYGGLGGTVMSNTFGGMAGMAPNTAFVYQGSANWQDAPLSATALVKVLNVTGFGGRRNIAISNANVDGVGITFNLPLNGDITYNISNLNTIGLIRKLPVIAINGLDYTTNPLQQRVGSLALAATDVFPTTGTIPVVAAYTSIAALSAAGVGTDLKASPDIIISDQDNATTNAGANVAITPRVALGSNFNTGPVTLSGWLDLTTMDWTSIQAGSGTNWFVRFSNPSNAGIATANIVLTQLQGHQMSTFAGAGNQDTQYSTWMALSNVGDTYTFPALPSTSPGSLATTATISNGQQAKQDWGMAAFQVPAGNPYYSGWDSNTNLYDVVNRAIIGYGANDTLASNAMSVNKFNIGGANILFPVNLSYCTSCTRVTVSGNVNAYRWNIVPALTGVSVLVQYHDQVGAAACPAGWAACPTGTNYCCSNLGVQALTNGSFNVSVPLAANQYNKIIVDPVGSGNGDTGGNSQTITFCTGTPSPATCNPYSATGSSCAAGTTSFCSNPCGNGTTCP